MSVPNAPAVTPSYEDSHSATFVYFDIVAAHGTMNGAVQIELASRTLVPNPRGHVEIRFRTTGHVRCTPIAAAQLRDSLDAAIKMLEQPQQQSGQAGTTLN
jgi:hypothetical protein